MLQKFCCGIIGAKLAVSEAVKGPWIQPICQNNSHIFHSFHSEIHTPRAYFFNLQLKPQLGEHANLDDSELHPPSGQGHLGIAGTQIPSLEKRPDAMVHQESRLSSPSPEGGRPTLDPGAPHSPARRADAVPLCAHAWRGTRAGVEDGRIRAERSNCPCARARGNTRPGEEGTGASLTSG